MTRPRIRQGNQFPPPYPLNQFPDGFAQRVGRQVVYLVGTRASAKIGGEDWERIFSSAIDGSWQPSNVGLDDISLGDAAWGAKSVQNNRPHDVNRVRLVSGRNSPEYSFGYRPEDPAELGGMVLQIWNERVAEVRARYRHVRTIVLIKGTNLQELAIYERETVPFDLDRFTWTRNRNQHLEGRDQLTGDHKFTWQSTGTQFTIIDEVPEDALKLRLRTPDSPTEESIERYLDSIGYDESWVTVID